MHEMFTFLTVMQYFHCYFVFFEREVHVFTCKTASLKALFIEQLVIAELSLAQKRVQRSTMGKKISLPMHLRNFGSHVTVRPPARYHQIGQQ